MKREFSNLLDPLSLSVMCTKPYVILTCMSFCLTIKYRKGVTSFKHEDRIEYYSNVL